MNSLLRDLPLPGKKPQEQTDSQQPRRRAWGGLILFQAPVSPWEDGEATGPGPWRLCSVLPLSCLLAAALAEQPGDGQEICTQGEVGGSDLWVLGEVLLQCRCPFSLQRYVFL